MGCLFVLSVKNFTEILVDSRAIVRNNTERCLVHFAQLPPTVTFCKTIGQHHNQDIDIDTIH